MLPIYRYIKSLSELVNADYAGRVNPNARENWSRATGSNPIKDAKSSLGDLRMYLFIQVLSALGFCISIALISLDQPGFDAMSPSSQQLGLFVGAFSLLSFLAAAYCGSLCCFDCKETKNAIDFWDTYNVAGVAHSKGPQAIHQLVNDQLLDHGYHLLERSRHGLASPLLPHTERRDAIAGLLFGKRNLTTSEQLKASQAIQRAACLICGVETAGVDLNKIVLRFPLVAWPKRVALTQHIGPRVDSTLGPLHLNILIKEI